MTKYGVCTSHFVTFSQVYSNHSCLLCTPFLINILRSRIRHVFTSPIKEVSSLSEKHRPELPAQSESKEREVTNLKPFEHKRRLRYSFIHRTESSLHFSFVRHVLFRTHCSVSMLKRGTIFNTDTIIALRRKYPCTSIGKSS